MQRPVISEDQFGDSFDETDFIEKLTRKLVFLQQQQQQQHDSSGNSSAEFVSDSFVKTFQASLESLQKLKEKVDKKIDSLQEETKEQENKHKAKLQQLQDRFDQHLRHFKDIDKRVSRVGSAAATIGNRLQTLDNHRERALQCKELFDTFLHLNNILSTTSSNSTAVTNEAVANKLFSDPPRLLKLFLEYEIDMHKYRIQKNNMQKVTAGSNKANSYTSSNKTSFQSRSYEEIYEKVLLCKQLYNMSQELDVDRLQTAKHAIIIITKELENKILQDFENALYDNNYQTMKECAIILFEFTGGAESCIATYISKINCFSDSRFAKDLELVTSYSSPTDHPSDNSVLPMWVSNCIEVPVSSWHDKRIKTFFQTILQTLLDEYKIIQRVFNRPDAVMAQLLKKMFEKRIQKFVDGILRHDLRYHTLLYMRTLATLYACTLHLAAISTYLFLQPPVAPAHFQRQQHQQHHQHHQHHQQQHQSLHSLKRDSKDISAPQLGSSPPSIVLSPPALFAPSSSASSPSAASTAANLQLSSSSGNGSANGTLAGVGSSGSGSNNSGGSSSIVDEHSRNVSFGVVPTTFLVPFEAIVTNIFSSYLQKYVSQEVKCLETIFDTQLTEERQQQQLQQQQQQSSDDASNFFSLEMALNFIHASEEAAVRCRLLLTANIPSILPQSVFLALTSPASSGNSSNSTTPLSVTGMLTNATSSSIVAAMMNMGPGAGLVSSTTATSTASGTGGGGGGDNNSSSGSVVNINSLSHQQQQQQQEGGQGLSIIFRVLLKWLGKVYLQEQLDRAVQVLPVACIQSYSKTLPQLQKFYQILYFVNQIVIFIQNHFHMHIFPPELRVSSSTMVNELSSCELEKNILFAKLEDKIALGIEKSLSALVSCVEKILSGQQKSDYRKKDDSSVDYTPGSITHTCRETINFVQHVLTVLFYKNLDGNNLVMLSQEFGNRVAWTLVQHYKKFMITQGMGGMQLLQDLTAYRQMAGTLFTNVGNNGSNSVIEWFDVVKDISVIHHVSAENVRVVFTETNLSKLDRSEVLQLIKTRADWKQAWIGKYI